MNPGVLLLDTAFPALKSHILEHTGLAYYADKDEDFATRICRRLMARNIAEAGEYLDVLERSPKEMDYLVGELTIGETYFFRQPDHFALLRNTILPELLARKASTRQLRIWSAGSATGAEPYSLGILLDLEFATQLRGWDVSILATDINVEFLAQARAARFADWALRETPPEIKARCFRHEGRQWFLHPAHAARVTFRNHNLASNTHPALDKLPFDLIFCRNVLIYFSRETISAVASRLFNYLEHGGWLLVGHAEPNSQLFHQFQVVSTPAGTVYRKGADGAVTHAPSRGVDFFAYQDGDLKLPVLPPNPPRQPAPTKPVVSSSIAIAEPQPQVGVDDVRILADRGQWDVAAVAADRLVRRDPLNAPAQFTLALILEHNGDHKSAQTALRRAIYLDREFALAHYHLATSLQASGDADPARRSFGNVLRLIDLLSPTELLPHGDGITAHELGELSRMHLELLVK